MHIAFQSKLKYPVEYLMHVFIVATFEDFSLIVNCLCFKFQVFSNHVERHVEFVLNSQWYIDSENCVQIIFDADVKPLKTDWIGIFRVSSMFIF